MRFLSFFFLLLTLGCAQLSRLGVKSPEREKKFFHVKWAKNLDYNYVPGNLPITYGGASMNEDTLFVGALDGSFHAFDAENGRELWKVKESTPLASVALVHGEHVYYGSQGGRLFVRRQMTGELKYAIDLGAPIEAAPVFHEGRLILYLRGHQIVCLDAETGKIVWSYRRAVPVTVTLQRTTRPLVVNNRVMVGFADGFAGALSLQEGTLLWEKKIVDTQKFVDVDLNPLWAEGTLIMGAPYGELKGLDPRDGSIKRQFDVVSLAHPLLRGQSLVVGTASGEVVFLSLDGKVLKRGQVSEQAINQLWWWKDHVVVSTFGGELLAIDPLSFQKIDRFQFGHAQSALFGDVALSERGIGVLTSRNRLFYFE
jgi:outer membrane protein assembly factor BamB